MSIAEDSELRGIIFKLVKSAIRRLTGDKVVANTFCAELANYVNQNADEFIDHYGEISIDSLQSWLSEFPVETLSN